MKTPTQREQLSLELANRARMNPTGEFDALIVNAADKTGVDQGITDNLRFFDVDLTVFQQQIANEVAVAPLAWNEHLATSAETHTGFMIDFDSQSHQLPGEPGFLERAQAAGYNDLRVFLENVYAFVQSEVHAHASFFIDWGSSPTGIQAPPNHRYAILNPDATEAGIDVTAEDNAATSVGPWLVTQHFGTRFDYAPQIVGVVIDDRDGDDFYDLGEGLGGVTVTVEGGGDSWQTETWNAGGYQIEVPAGSYTVTFSGGALGSPIAKPVTLGGENVKLDAMLDESSPATVREGTDADDTFTATADVESFRGGDGFDRVVFDGMRDQTDLSQDSFESIEAFVFDDGQLRMDLDGVVGSVYRLYRATYNREPATEGVSFWTGHADNGLSIEEIADFFVDVPEFTAIYGGQSPEAVIGGFYSNVFLREPLDAGFDFWVDVLNDPDWDVSDILLAFADSPEGKALVLPQIEDGIWLDEMSFI